MYSSPYYKGLRGWLYVILALLLSGCVVEPLAQQHVSYSRSKSAFALSIGALPVNMLANPGPQCIYRSVPPLAVSRRRAQIRILTQNAFGLDKDGNESCQARATRLGTIIANAAPPYDIVALQEHWDSLDLGIVDCGADQLDNAIWSTGRYRNSNNFFRHRPVGEFFQGETDGGLSIFTLHTIEKFDENEWDDIPGLFNILHGSTFSRIKLMGTNISIDFYNTHLLAEEADDCSPNCRRQELQELRDEIILHSKTSGNPVIVVGDFNIGGPPSCRGNDRYADIMELLENPRDLWLEAHPNNEGFTADCVRNTVKQEVEGPCTTRDRIDFIFLVESPNLTNSTFQVVLRAENDMKLAEFMRSNGKHVADHFGLEAFLEVRERGRVNIPFIGLAQKCMAVSGDQTADGTAVQLFACNGGAGQRWTLGYDGQLRSTSGKCLTIRDGSTANRTLAEISTCSGSAAQRFDYTAAGELRSRLDPNKCVEVRGGFTDNGTPIQLFDCNGTASQQWTDRPPPVVDANRCAQIAAEISLLRQELPDTPKVNERKQILKEIGRLVDRLQQLGCPQK